MKKITLLFVLSLFSYLGLYAQENIALNKTITVSTGSNPSNINDGSTGSRWESTHGLDDQWVKIDLGDVYDLTSSSVLWEGASAKTYEFQVSGNDIDWRTVTQRTETAGARLDSFEFTEEDDIQQVRYVRLNLQTRTTIYGFSIYEWEIYGTLSVVEPIATSLDIKPKNVTLLTNLPEELTILSLNNSLIDYNDQPSIFNQLASSGGKVANWTKQTRLGQSLRYHYEEGEGLNSANEPTAKMTVRSKAWTHILLQEQSNKPLTDPADFLESVKLWIQYVKDYCPNPNARIIITLNWPYTDATDFDGDMAKLYANYKSIAQELGITICPVGNAYDMIRTIDGETAKNALYTDNRHPSVLASYLAACTVYSTLFNSSPVGLSYYPGSINASDAQRMQTHAWNAYQGHDDVVNDIEGTIRFTSIVMDQFNRAMVDVPQLNWTVNGGGDITDGIFSTNGEEGSYVATVESNGFSSTANITVKKASEIVVDEYFAEIEKGSSYEQDFDGIGTEATATLPTGWKMDKNTSAPRTLASYNLAQTQTEQSGGNGIIPTAKNGIYNFGAGDVATAADRAIGGISTDAAGGARGVNIYLKIRNTGSEDIKSLDIEYDVEKYRMGNNGAGFTMQMYYSADGVVWQSAGDNFKTLFAKDDATIGYDEAPGDTRNVSANLLQSLKAGEDIYLAWNYSVASGTVCQGAQALGLDNVMVKASDTELVDYEIILDNSTYDQNFDQIGMEATATLPLGWKIEKRLDSPLKLGSYSSAVTQTEQIGGNNIASDARNGIYNFGAGAAATATDRAIGGISTGIAGGTRCVNIYFKMRNTGTTDINSFDIEYDVEKYRMGSNSAGFVMQMYYSTDGENWTSAGDDFRTFFASDNTIGGYASVPGAVVNVVANLDQKVEVGQDLYLAWNYSVASASAQANAAQALGLDNVMIKSNNSTTSLSVDTKGLANVYCYNKTLSVTGDEVKNIEVYSINGLRIVSFNNSGTFDLSGFASGIYLIKVTDSKNNTITSKIVM